MDVLQRMNLPVNQWDVRISEISDSAKHKAWVVSYVEDIANNIKQGKGMYISHRQSTGKSAIAAICLKAAASKGYIGLWLTCDRVPQYIIEKYAFDDDLSVIDRAESVPLLILDEFAFPTSSKTVGGKVKVTGKIGEREKMIETLVRRRIDAKKSTIITSNIGPKALEEVYPEFYRVMTESLKYVSTDPDFIFRPHS